MNFQVNGSHRRITLIPLLPLLSAIETEVQTMVGTQPQQLRLNRILHDGQRVSLHLFFIDNPPPLAAKVGCMVNHRPPIISPIIIDHHKGLSRVGCRQLYVGNPATGGGIDELGRKICPCAPAVAGELQATIIGTNPDHIAIERTRRYGQNSRMIFSPCLVDRKPAALILVLLTGIIGCEIRTEERPVLPAITAIVNKLAAIVHPTAIKRIECDGRIPVEPQFGPVRMHRLDEAGTSRLPVYQAQVTPLRHSIYIAIIIGLKHHIKAIAEIHLLPVVIGDTTILPHLARSDPGAIVLHTPGHIVGDIHIVANVVELRQRQIGDKPPRPGPVAADIETAIIPFDQVIGILGMYPKSVVIRMHP